MRSYTEWLRRRALLLTNCPAICILQLRPPACRVACTCGPSGFEAMLLRVAACFEAARQRRLWPGL